MSLQTTNSSEPTLSPTLDGLYLTKKLGAGAFGEVYLYESKDKSK